MKVKWTRVVVLLLLLLFVAATVVLLPGIRRSVREGGREAVRSAVLQSAVECYTVEGAYPESLEHLMNNYGLSVNQRDYIVIYQAMASNQMPDVQVLVRGESR